MELYIIRHGDPDYANDTLTELGWKQAEALVPRLLKINPTDVYASPRGRAQDTAKPSLKALGMEYTIENWMNESMDYMQFCKDEADYDAGYTVSIADGAVLNKDFAPARTQALADMIAASDEFMARHGYVREGMRYKIVEANDRRLACFCHGGFGSAWISHLLGCHPLFSWYRICFNPSTVTKFYMMDLGNGYAVPRAEYIGDASHLWNADELFVRKS